MRKETMSGIWRSPELKPKVATQSPRKTITSTPNTISELCRRTERNSREGVVFIPMRRHRCRRQRSYWRVDASSSSSATSELARTRIRGRSQNAATKEIRSRSKELAEHDRDEFAPVCFPLLVRGPLAPAKSQRPGRSVARIDHRSDEGVPAPSITLALSLGRAACRSESVCLDVLRSSRRERCASGACAWVGNVPMQLGGLASSSS